MLLNYARTVIACGLREMNLDRRAVTAIEYALVAALISVVIIYAVSTAGKNLSSTFNKVASEL